MQNANLKNSFSKNNYKENPNVKMSDKDEHLEVYHYTNCTNDSEDELKTCRGLVFDGDKLVLRSFPYTEEYVASLHKEHIEKTLDGVEEVRFFKAIEGALIRVFNYKGKWYISTHRKLDAFKTKWSNRDSFGLLFLKALDQEYGSNEKLRERLGGTGTNTLKKLINTLDKDAQYMFIVKNTGDNCIVCEETKENNLFFVGKYQDNELKFTDDIGIPYPKELKFDSLDELVEHVQNENERKYPGVMIFLPNNRQVRVVSEKYNTLFRARGNQSSIKFRYLQVRMQEEEVNKLMYLYPHYYDTFEKYENILYDKAKEIYDAYVKRFIKKQYITLPKNEFEIMRIAHAWHLADKSENKVSLNKVIDVLNEQKATTLNRLIKNTILKNKQEIPEKLIRSNSTQKLVDSTEDTKASLDNDSSKVSTTNEEKKESEVYETVDEGHSTLEVIPETPKEEPVVETIPEPTTEEPVAEAVSETPKEEPVVETIPEPTTEEPVAEAVPETPKEEPVVETIPEPKTEEPVAEAIPEPTTEEAAAEAVTETPKEEAVVEAIPEPKTEEPVSEAIPEPPTEEPVVDDIPKTEQKNPELLKKMIDTDDVVVIVPDEGEEELNAIENVDLGIERTAV